MHRSRASRSRRVCQGSVNHVAAPPLGGEGAPLGGAPPLGLRGRRGAGSGQSLRARAASRPSLGARRSSTVQPRLGRPGDGDGGGGAGAGHGDDLDAARRDARGAQAPLHRRGAARARRVGRDLVGGAARRRGVPQAPPPRADRAVGRGEQARKLARSSRSRRRAPSSPRCSRRSPRPTRAASRARRRRGASRCSSATRSTTARSTSRRRWRGCARSRRSRRTTPRR